MYLTGHHLLRSTSKPKKCRENNWCVESKLNNWTANSNIFTCSTDNQHIRGLIFWANHSTESLNVRIIKIQQNCKNVKAFFLKKKKKEFEFPLHFHWNETISFPVNFGAHVRANAWIFPLSTEEEKSVVSCVSKYFLFFEQIFSRFTIYFYVHAGHGACGCGRKAPSRSAGSTKTSFKN